MPTLRLLTTGAGSGNHDGEVSACAYSPKEHLVLSGGWDGFLRLWDGQLGTQVGALRASNKPISACAVSPDGKHWLSGTLDGMLGQWDASAQRQVSLFLAHTRPISAIRFEPIRPTLATSSWDRNVMLWSLGHEREGRTLSGHADIVSGCRFTPDGRGLLSWSHDGTVRLWEVKRARLLSTFTGHLDRILSAGISPDGRWAASGSRDGVLKLWDLQGGKEAGSLKLGGEIRGCFFLLDAQLLVTAEAEGRLRLISVPGLEVEADLSTGLSIQCGDLAPSGAQMALGCADGRVHFVSVEGFDHSPLVAVAVQTGEDNPSPLQRLLGRRRPIFTYACRCPVCRQSFDWTDLHSGTPSWCPGCHRKLRVYPVSAP